MPPAVMIAITVASFVYSAVSQIRASQERSSAKRKAEAEAAAAAEAARMLKINTRSTAAPLRVLYGRHMIGGNEIFFALSGVKNEILWIVDTYSEGPCDGIHQVGGVDQLFMDGQIYTAFAGKATYYFHNGAGDQVVDANLAAAVSEWTDRNKYTCYGVWRLEFDENIFMGLPARTVILNGRTLYDFRDASTGFSRNPVLIEYDYRSNSRYGLGEAVGLLDPTSYQDAANYCDTKGWIANLLVDPGKSSQDFFDEINNHMRGETILYDNKWFKRYFDLNYESTCPAITDEHICQDDSGKAMISVSQPSRFNLPDGLNVHIIDPDKNYTDDTIMIGEAVGQIEDIDLYGAPRLQAACIGVYELERARLNRAIRGTFRDDCAQYECCDVLPLTSSALGLTAQLVRVVETRVREDGLVELGFIFEDLALYNDAYDLIPENVYKCTVPDPTAEPPCVGNVILTEETYTYRLRTFTRLFVEFDPPSNYAWFDYVEVWISYDDIAWEHAFNAAGDFEIANVEEGKLYYIRMKTVNLYGVKQQDANDRKVSKLITGYVNSPDSISALYAIVTQNAINLYADKLTDTDIELYEFRLGTGWSGGIFLSAQKAPNLSLSGVKPGNHTFLCNTLSNNGVYGTTARSVSAVLRDPPDGWTVDAGLTMLCTYDFNVIEDETGASWGPAYHGLSIDYGQAFLRVQGVDLSPYVGLGYAISLFDSGNVRTDGFIDIAGAGETLETDLATNGDFEDYTGTQDDGVDDDFADWTRVNYGNGEGDKVEATADSYGGLNAVKITRIVTGYPYLYRDFTIDPRKLYKITARTKGTGTHDAVFSIYNATHYMWLALVQGTGITAASWGLWTYYFTAATHTGPITIRVYLSSADANGTVVYWDDFTLQEVSDCAADGVHIVSEKNGSTQDWRTIGYGFNYNDSLYTFTVLDDTLLSGEHVNTEHLMYSGVDYLRCAHEGGVLTGTFKSEVFDIGTSGRYLIYVLCDILVVGGGTTWDDLVPYTTTWDRMGDVTWDSLFSLNTGPRVQISCLYGDTSPPTNRVEKLEILSAIVTGRYFQVEIKITDPSAEIRAMVEKFTLKFCQ